MCTTSNIQHLGFSFTRIPLSVVVAVVSCRGPASVTVPPPPIPCPDWLKGLADGAQWLASLLFFGGLSFIDWARSQTSASVLEREGEEESDGEGGRKQEERVGGGRGIVLPTVSLGA